MTKQVLQHTIVDASGNPVASAELEIRREVDGQLAILWQDRAGTLEAANPVQASATGFVQVYLDPGRYKLIPSGSGVSGDQWRDHLIFSETLVNVDDINQIVIDAAAYRDEAMEWAHAAEDEPVGGSPEMFSALHYANKAEKWAQYPEDTPIPGESPTAYSAMHWALKAQDSVLGILADQIDAASEASEILDDDYFGISVPESPSSFLKISFGAVKAAILSYANLFLKSDMTTPAFTKTGAGTISIKAGSAVGVNGNLYAFTDTTAVTMPSLTAGTDYAIFINPDGTLQAVAWTANTGTGPTAPVSGGRLIGGFHYAPGGNGGNSQVGGNTTPGINEHSIWDIKFRPNCPDPRGMAFFGSAWMDIYFLGMDHYPNGTSRHNVAIANGNVNTPIRPLIFGGNGTARATLDGWMANEIMLSHGKRLPTYWECCTAFFGVTEGVSRGSAPVTTGLGTTNTGSSNTDEEFTSWCGIIQATGVHWVWCSDVSYAYVASGFSADTYTDPGHGRGEIAHDNATAFRQVLAGGKYNNGAGEAGSRAFDNANAPQTFSLSISARGVAEHFVDS